MAYCNVAVIVPGVDLDKLLPRLAKEGNFDGVNISWDFVQPCTEREIKYSYTLYEIYHDNLLLNELSIIAPSTKLLDNRCGRKGTRVKKYIEEYCNIRMAKMQEVKVLVFACNY